MDLSYYDILQIDKTNNSDDIKKAYKRLAMLYHPDRTNGDKNMEDKFKLIQEAYSILSDATLKHNYDMYGTIDNMDSLEYDDHDILDDMDILHYIFNTYTANTFSVNDPKCYTVKIDMFEYINGCTKQIHQGKIIENICIPPKTLHNTQIQMSNHDVVIVKHVLKKNTSIDDNGHVRISIEISFVELMCGFIRELNVGGEKITITKDRFFNTNKEEIYTLKNNIHMIVSYILTYNKTDDVFAKYHKLFKKLFYV